MTAIAKKYSIRIGALLLTSLVTAGVFSSEPPDNFLWLEEILSQQSLDWAKAHSAQATQRLEALPYYKEIETQFREVAYAKDRLPSPLLINGKIFNFWQDENHIRGIIRFTSTAEYSKPQPTWTTAFDIDDIAKAESENWVYKGLECLDASTRCLISLSRGGKDATVVREVDLATQSFVENGFVIPEAKQRVSWLDRDHLLVGTDWGPDSLTDSGYPRVIKRWTRGTPLTQAVTVFEGLKSYVSSWSSVYPSAQGTFVVLGHSTSFFTAEIFVLDSQNNPVRFQTPDSANFQGMFGDQLIFSLRSDWETGNTSLKAGTLLSASYTDITVKSPRVLFEPTTQTFMDDLAITSDGVYLSVLSNVIGDLLRFEMKSTGWVGKKVSLPTNGSITFSASSSTEPLLVVNYASFLQPPSQYFVENQNGVSNATLIRQVSAKFDSSPYETVQLWAKSPDGTAVPYFVVRKKGLAKPAATLLYGYGGFEISMLPSYLNGVGKAWLERGGVYVLSNIRGGGEFGPNWHESAILKNRHKAFEDFIAIAEDLIARQITTPKQLGIRGGSNGGLLVSTVTMMRPDLFNAVVCQVPLVDMLRYHKLLAGASWMGEYGDPEDPDMRKYILTYSPYQKVSASMSYPEMFVATSTKDDRVHPAHARKLVARLEELKHPVIYYENIDGGHSGASNLEETIKLNAKIWSYLVMKLMP